MHRWHIKYTLNERNSRSPQNNHCGAPFPGFQDYFRLQLYYYTVNTVTLYDKEYNFTTFFNSKGYFFFLEDWRLSTDTYFIYI